MTTKAEQIAVAMVNLARSPAMASVVAASVLRDQMRVFDEGTTLPALVVEMGSESAPVRNLIQFEDRRIAIYVSVVSGRVIADESPFTSGDAALVEYHARLLADTTLGGLALDIREGDTVRTRERLGADLAEVRKTYEVEYRTAVGSL